MVDKLRIFKIKSGLNHEKELLSMLESKDFSIVKFMEKAKRYTSEISITACLCEDNTIDINKFKDQAMIEIKREIRESLKVLEDMLAPIKEAQALLDDKEIRELLKE